METTKTNKIFYQVNGLQIVIFKKISIEKFNVIERIYLIKSIQLINVKNILQNKYPNFSLIRLN